LNINTEKKIRKSQVATGLIIVLLSFLVSTTGISFYLLQRSTMYSGVTIDHIDVGGLVINEAQNKITTHFDNQNLEGGIQFSYGDSTWDMNTEDMGLTYDYTRALNEAYNVGRQGNYYERLKEIISLYRKPHNIELIPIYDNERLDAFLYNMERNINQLPKDATIIRYNGKFVIADEKVGQKLNTNKAKAMLTEKIMDLKFDKRVGIDLSVETESPRITSEVLSTIDQLLASYSTTFNASNTSRTKNIALSAKAINGTLLMPGDVFSFNEVVGPRSREQGYQDAPVIFNGELVEGVGGGVCQVSSTIYNAVLLSDLKIVERVKHSIPSTYVPKGQDATVSFGVLDFKFQNDFPNPIYIETFTKGNQMHINIYGNRTDSKSVRITSIENEVVKRAVEVKYDNAMLQGQERIEQEGRDGYRVTTYKTTLENGKEVSKEQISKDYYRPQTKIIVKGTKKPPKEIEKTENKENFTEEEN